MICQLVLEYFQLQLSDILFFLEAFGLFGIFWPSKGLTAFLRPKNPKKASGLQKKPNVFKLQLKILQKKLTHHEKMPAFFLSLVPYHIDAHSSMILYNVQGIWILNFHPLGLIKSSPKGKTSVELSSILLHSIVLRGSC